MVYIFPEFKYFFEVEDVGDADDSGLTLAAPGVLLVDVDELVGKDILIVLLVVHFQQPNNYKRKTPVPTNHTKCL